MNIPENTHRDTVIDLNGDGNAATATARLEAVRVRVMELDNQLLELSQVRDLSSDQGMKAIGTLRLVDFAHD
jgi:hypothetical protein